MPTEVTTERPTGYETFTTEEIEGLQQDNAQTRIKLEAELERREEEKFQCKTYVERYEAVASAFRTLEPMCDPDKSVKHWLKTHEENRTPIEVITPFIMLGCAQSMLDHDAFHFWHHESIGESLVLVLKAAQQLKTYFDTQEHYEEVAMGATNAEAYYQTIAETVQDLISDLTDTEDGKDGE